MGDVREATLDDVDLLAEIGASGFYDDPVLSWVFRDPSERLEQLRTIFGDLVRDYLPDRGAVHLADDACAAFWRPPSFEHGQTASDRANDRAAEAAKSPFSEDVMKRLEILGSVMSSAHPHVPHWYLNVLSTVPARQSQGLGAKTMREVLTVCDTEGIPAHLESSNPKNMTLYRRHGFEQTGELFLPGGPSLYPMWRVPQTWRETGA